MEWCERKILLLSYAQSGLIVFPSASVPLRCRLCAVTLEREGGDKCIGFLDLSRERKGQEAEGGREGERRALKLPAAHRSPPRTSSFFHHLFLFLLTWPLLLARRGEPFVPIVVCRRSASCPASRIQSVALGARGWISTAPLVIRGELLSPGFTQPRVIRVRTARCRGKGGA